MPCTSIIRQDKSAPIEKKACFNSQKQTLNGVDQRTPVMECCLCDIVTETTKFTGRTTT